MNSNIKIKILGSGPTGALLAISLSRIGCEVTIVDVKSKQEIIARNRAYALTHSSRKLLENLDLWHYIEKKSNRFTNLYLRDNVIRKQIIFNEQDLTTNSRYDSSVGWILEHSILMNILIATIEDDKNITLLLDNKSNLENQNYDFIIGADGVLSPSRKFNKIKEFKYKYKQSCLTTKLLIRNSDSKNAYEILRQEGPFALLPIRKDLFQIVWTASKENCLKRKSMSKQYLLDLLSSILPKEYEPDCIVGRIEVFPNNFFIAIPFFKRRFILIGESAHSFHPIGGQGLNLCWRDISVLTNNIKLASKENINLDHIPLYYYINRLKDVLLIGIITDILLRFFSNKLYILLPIRKMIFKILKTSKQIRKFTLEIMTNGIFTIK